MITMTKNMKNLYNITYKAEVNYNKSHYQCANRHLRTATVEGSEQAQARVDELRANGVEVVRVVNGIGQKVEM